jgi:DNA replicative helicase MCM subunit Mcm2 (Cdc46/Mcm family)
MEEEHVKQFLSLKKKMDVRLTNVPPLKEITLETIRNIRQCHVNKYMVVYGTVIRCTSVKNRETKKDFACKFCGKIYTAKSDILEYNSFKLPPICGGEVEKPHNPFVSMLNAMKRKGTFNKKAFLGTHIG